nr:putative mitochondrial protein [Ipomoea batatas]
MGDMKKLHEEMRDIHATVQKLEDLPASFHTLSDTIAQLTAAVNALVANTPSAPTSTAVTHSDANQATPETVVLSPPDPTPSTRVTRLEFPTFSGKEDPLVWLHRCELFFDKSPVSDHEKVSTAAYYMFDVAQLWFSKRIQDNQQFSWAQFKAACTLRFGPPRSINPLGDEERALAAFGNPKSPRCQPEVIPELLATLSMLTQPLQLREFRGEPSALPYRSSKAEPGTEHSASLPESADSLKLSTKKGAASVPCPTTESRYDFGRAPPSTAWGITSSVPSAIAGSFSIGETFSSSICIADSAGSCSGSVSNGVSATMSNSASD